MPRYARKWLARVLPAMLWLASTVAYSSPLESRGVTPGKPAWKWTVAERLARRFDPEAMKARAAEQDKTRAWFKHVPADDSDPFFSTKDKGTEPPQRISIEGRKTPELFLTWELFTSLLSRAFPPGGEHAEQLTRPIEEWAAALGFGRDLWPRLAKVAAPLLKPNKNGYGLLPPLRRAAMGWTLGPSTSAVSERRRLPLPRPSLVKRKSCACFMRPWPLRSSWIISGLTRG
jgi:hypothetical protein